MGFIHKVYLVHAAYCSSTDKFVSVKWLNIHITQSKFILNMDLFCSIPVRTIFDPHPQGCVAICMTADARYLATLSNSSPQVSQVYEHIF